MDHDIIDEREPHSESDIVPEGSDDLDPQTGAADATDAEQMAEGPSGHVSAQVSEVFEAGDFAETGETADTTETTDVAENREAAENDESAEVVETAEHDQTVKTAESADVAENDETAENADVAENDDESAEISDAENDVETAETADVAGAAETAEAEETGPGDSNDAAHSAEPDEVRRTPVTPDNGYSRESYAIHATRSELPLFNDALNGGRSDVRWLSSLSSMLGGSKGPVGSAEGAAAVAHAAIDRRRSTGEQSGPAS